MKTNTPSNSNEMLYVGIDFHKRYSVVHVLDAAGLTVKKGRIEMIIKGPRPQPSIIANTMATTLLMRIPMPE